jgi:hypothetical protein
MLALLASAAVATWWNFTNDEFEEKKRNSVALPIFVVCYSHWCPHCSGLPEGTVQYSESDGNRSDVLVTMIDCAERHAECAHFQIAGTPHMVLVMGPRRKYWPRVYSKVGRDWNAFIDRYVRPSLRAVATDAELAAAKREPADGGTAFHLETPRAGTALLRELANLSREFRIYNDTFTYRVSRARRGALLTAHTAPDCAAAWDGRDLRAFLEAHKFGSRHEYDQDEYRLLARRTKAAVLVVEEAATDGQKYALRSLPRRFCDAIAFGWLKVKDSPHLLREFRRNASELPFLMYSDQNKCRAFLRGRTADAETSGFLDKAANGELCGQWYPPQSSRSGAREARATFTGQAFSVVYVVSGLLLVMTVRFWTPDSEAKQE